MRAVINWVRAWLETYNGRSAATAAVVVGVLCTLTSASLLLSR